MKGLLKIFFVDVVTGVGLSSRRYSTKGFTVLMISISVSAKTVSTLGGACKLVDTCDVESLTTHCDGSAGQCRKSSIL